MPTSSACRAGQPIDAASARRRPHQGEASQGEGVIGGPHATPLGPELLAHYENVDLVASARATHVPRDRRSRREGRESAGVAGTVYRDGEKIITAPERKNVPISMRSRRRIIGSTPTS